MRKRINPNMPERGLGYNAGDVYWDQRFAGRIGMKISGVDGQHWYFHVGEGGKHRWASSFEDAISIATVRLKWVHRNDR